MKVNFEDKVIVTFDEENNILIEICVPNVTVLWPSHLKKEPKLTEDSNEQCRIESERNQLLGEDGPTTEEFESAMKTKLEDVLEKIKKSRIDPTVGIDIDYFFEEYCEANNLQGVVSYVHKQGIFLRPVNNPNYKGRLFEEDFGATRDGFHPVGQEKKVYMMSVFNELKARLNLEESAIFIPYDPFNTSNPWDQKGII